MTRKTDWVAFCDVWCECWHFRDAWQQIEEEKDQETREISHSISGLLYRADITTQAQLAEKLLQFENPITHVFATLLGPRGNYGWKLILKRSGRGAPMRDPAAEGEFSYTLDEIIEEHGKRGALKRLAKMFKMSPAAVRSAIRREHAGSTYYKRRKRSGRK